MGSVEDKPPLGPAKGKPGGVAPAVEDRPAP